MSRKNDPRWVYWSTRGSAGIKASIHRIRVDATLPLRPGESEEPAPNGLRGFAERHRSVPRWS
jgi:hypothetical protein